MKFFLKMSAILVLCLFAIPVFADTPTVGPGDTAVTPVAQTLVQVGGAILMAFLTFLTAMLSKFANAKAEESTTNRILATLSSFVQSVVADIDVTLRPKLEAALSDGVLTAIEKAELRATALNIVLTKLPSSVVAMARGVFGAGLETKILGLIENHVTALHATKAEVEIAKARVESIAAAAITGPTTVPQ